MRMFWDFWVPFFLCLLFSGLTLFVAVFGREDMASGTFCINVMIHFFMIPTLVANGFREERRSRWKYIHRPGQDVGEDHPANTSSGWM